MQEAKKISYFPSVPDLTRKKLLLVTEEPTLDKITPIYNLLDRERKIKNLQEKADVLSVSICYKK